jgi:hypothetical protein
MVTTFTTSRDCQRPVPGGKVMVTANEERKEANLLFVFATKQRTARRDALLAFRNWKKTFSSSSSSSTWEISSSNQGTSDLQALEHDDDGFLTTSEIATLKMDADWVILSACNTAGPQSENAQALSGIARAFFYAGARALLVSHWEVGSDAAVKLTTRTFGELKAHPNVGRAEAFRVSMRELIQKGSIVDAHPSQWAPFVIVGEGR